ncbi:MAG: protease modulator HflC, partial [Nitrospinota bacterium]
MKPNFFLFALPIGLLIIITTMLESLFIVKEHEQVVITQFGKFVRSQTKAGLDFKTPFIQDVFYYDKRLLDHDITPADVVTRDKRTLVIDNFAKWRITDPEKFYKRTRTTRVAKDRLRDIIFSELRLDFGDNDLNDIISGERSNIMKKVTERSNQKVKELDMGVEIVDVRIMRADFPPENQRAVFERMSAERNRIARQFRSEGDEEAKKI